MTGVAEVLSPESDTFDNYLLVGSDSRDAGDPNTGDSASSSGRRSDTIMVLRVDRSDGSAALLSIPRDLYVTVYGHTEPSRINAAFSENPAVLVQTVQTALGVPVHHYVEVDFVGFKDLVDALGGIELCFERPTRDTNTGLNITKPGCQVLDGVQALAYARSRHYEELIDETWHEDPRSDFGRTARQRDFVNRCLQSALAQVQQQPYRPLVQATAEQKVTEFSDVSGTVVGFRTPAFEEGLSVPGYHAHVLLDERRSGGHVLDHVILRGRVQVCVGTDLHLELPRTPEFARANLDPEDLPEPPAGEGLDPEAMVAAGATCGMPASL